MSNVAQYANQLMASMMREQVLNLCSNPDSVRRTVFIDSGDVDATEFNLSEARKSALVQAGSSCAKRYFEQPRWIAG